MYFLIRIKLSVYCLAFFGGDFLIDCHVLPLRKRIFISVVVYLLVCNLIIICFSHFLWMKSSGLLQDIVASCNPSFFNQGSPNPPSSGPEDLPLAFFEEGDNSHRGEWAPPTPSFFQFENEFAEPPVSGPVVPAQEATPAEEPLISDQNRWTELEDMKFNRLNPYHQEHLIKVNSKMIEKQFEIEKILEHTLRQEGYTPFSIDANRDKIRRLIFWPHGNPTAVARLYKHVREMLIMLKKALYFAI